MTDLNNPNDCRELFGELYRYSDAKVGDVIRFRDPELGEMHGTVLWCCAPQEIAGTQLAAHYIVDAPGRDWPETVFFNDVIADREQQEQEQEREREPRLQQCPYCGGMHDRGTFEQCPKNKRQ